MESYTDDQEMEALCKMFSSKDESELLLHLNHHLTNILPSNQYYQFDHPQEHPCIESSAFGKESGNYYNVGDHTMAPFFTADYMMDNQVLQFKSAHSTTIHDEMQLKRKYDEKSEDNSMSSQNSHKKSRPSRTQKSKKKEKFKKAETRLDDHVGEVDVGRSNGHSSSSCSSEPDSNASQQLIKGASKKGKAKVDRGSATDPQSVYARRRRERINERLRILQNLVPNGTKVDISTMLEEAVHYVKFLQLQIKLLSSDELWMYAPIAYNGMDIGLNYHNISPNFGLH